MNDRALVVGMAEIAIGLGVYDGPVANALARGCWNDRYLGSSKPLFSRLIGFGSAAMNGGKNVALRDDRKLREKRDASSCVVNIAMGQNKMRQVLHAQALKPTEKAGSGAIGPPGVDDKVTLDAGLVVVAPISLGGTANR